MNINTEYDFERFIAKMEEKVAYLQMCPDEKREEETEEYTEEFDE